MHLFAAVLAGIVINAGNGRSDVTKLTVTKKLIATKTKRYSGISTYKGGNYCGPGWGFTYQQILDGEIQKMPDAIDAIDQACKAHDYCYHENGYLTQGCNLVLTYDLVKVVTDPKSTGQQRIDAAIMAAVFFIESQSLDLIFMAGREAQSLADRIRSQLVNSGASMKSAIAREIRMLYGAHAP